MTDKQIAKEKMYRTVLQNITANSSKYMHIPVFVSTVNKLTDICNQILTESANQDKSTLQGTSDLKKEVEIKLVTETIKVSSLLSVFAIEIGDNLLYAKSTITKSNMYKIHNRETLNIARRVLKEATNYADKLNDYGLTEADIQTLQNLINEYESLVIAPRVVTAKTKQATANLAHLFAEADALLIYRLDKLMRVFKTSDPEFYELYFNSRNVINTSVRKKPTDKPETEETTTTEL